MIFLLQGLVETINQMTPAILKVVVVYLFPDHDIPQSSLESSLEMEPCRGRVIQTVWIGIVS